MIGFAPTARADEELTLTLPPSPAAQEILAAQQKAARSRVARTSVTPKRRTSLSSRGGYGGRQGTSERVVGRLGLLERATPIYRRRDTRNQPLVIAQAGTYVALQDDVGEWCGVLMADGSTGWIEKASVTQLDYQVVAPDSPAPASSFTDKDALLPRGTSVYFTGNAEALIAEAFRYMGTRYVWGGNTKNGIDCSGLIKNVFASQGFALPRLGTHQMAYGVPVPFDQLQPGDRLYFGLRKDGRSVTHTGLYIGNGQFIHSSSSRGGVTVSALSESMWSRLYVSARR
jgi:cell wall-associated NlpC family hydrolase